MSPTSADDMCPACQDVEAAVPTLEPGTEHGALVWLCPSCGHAWPLFRNGDLGAMARSSSARINAKRRYARA